MTAKCIVGLMGVAALTGCEKSHDERPMLRLSAVPGVEGNCLATIGGKSFDPQDPKALEAALAPYADTKSDVRIIGSGNVPYRCIGGVIYTMQRQGYKKVGFIAEPTSQSEK